MASLDAILAACVPILAIAILLSGIDDLFIDALWVFAALRRRRQPQPARPPAPAPEPRIAVFLPLWHEDRVIGRMLEHNLAAIRYGNYAVFAGAYPNDQPTVRAIRDLAARFPQVHLALCPHDGPTSKADCLNWIFQSMLAHEQRHRESFDVVVLHDAEDLIDPDGLSSIARYAQSYGMVQIPVLPLPTPLHKLTHGVYCDEFAEWEMREMPVRGVLGSFIPSAGVGTGYSRPALAKLAASNRNQVFDPACLTEDYDNSLRLYRLGCKQLFVPVSFEGHRPVATREYFPQRFRAALRQRTRWIMGNALQAWQRHGWSGGLRQVYCFWRDRKGLVGNPLCIAANLLFAYGAARWLWAKHAGEAWAFGAAAPFPAGLVWAMLLLQCNRLAVRMACVARIYGWPFACFVPLRVLWANWLNCCATVAALARYASARLRGRPLVWLKTEHAYPSPAVLAGHQRPLGETLVRIQVLDEAQLRHALATQPAGVRLGEHLTAMAALREEDLYRALSLQQNVPFEPLEPDAIPRWVARALPGSVARRWQVVPFRVSAGTLYVAGPELPTEEAQRELQRHTPLEIRFQYITRSNYQELTARFLASRKPAS